MKTAFIGVKIQKSEPTCINDPNWLITIKGDNFKHNLIVLEEDKAKVARKMKLHKDISRDNISQDNNLWDGPKKTETEIQTHV